MIGGDGQNVSKKKEQLGFLKSNKMYMKITNRSDIIINAINTEFYKATVMKLMRQLGFRGCKNIDTKN